MVVVEARWDDDIGDLTAIPAEEKTKRFLLKL